MTHICVSKLAIIGSDNGLSPDRRQAIIWTNAEILLIGPLGTNYSEIRIEILTFSFKKMRFKVSSVKRRPFCLGLNVLRRNRLFIRVCLLSKCMCRVYTEIVFEYTWRSHWHIEGRWDTCILSFADDIFKCISLINSLYCDWIYRWNLFSWIRMK